MPEYVVVEDSQGFAASVAGLQPLLRDLGQI